MSVTFYPRECFCPFFPAVYTYKANCAKDILKESKPRAKMVSDNVLIISSREFSIWNQTPLPDGFPVSPGSSYASLSTSKRVGKEAKAPHLSRKRENIWSSSPQPSNLCTTKKTLKVNEAVHRQCDESLKRQLIKSKLNKVMAPCLYIKTFDQLPLSIAFQDAYSYFSFHI